MPDMIVASTTATQKEIDHAVSADWRQGIPVEEDKPVEKPVEKEVAATSEEEVETAPASEPETKQDDQPVRGKGGFQKKIDKLTREKGEAIARNETLERELAGFKDKLEQIEKRLAPQAETKDDKPEAKPQFLTRPKPLESEIGTKYKDWDEYLLDLVDWKADEKLAARDKNAEAQETQEIQEARDAGYKESVTAFVKEVPDFNDAIQRAAKAGMKLPEPIIEKIKELPNGPAVTYYLVTNPEEALALVEMHPVEGFIALGRISQGLEAEVKPKPLPKTPAKPVSAAPAAVKPVAGHSARSGNSLQDISARSTDEYVRARQTQIREREARRY